MARLDNILIGLVIFALVIIVGSLTISDIGNTYSVNVSDANFDNVTTQANNILDTSYSTSQDQKDKMIGTGGEIDEDESWESMVKGSYSTIRLISNSFGLVGGVLTAVSNAIGIPVVFTTAALIIFTIIVTFGLIYLVFRFKG